VLNSPAAQLPPDQRKAMIAFIARAAFNPAGIADAQQCLVRAERELASMTAADLVILELRMGSPRGNDFTADYDPFAR
jgi:hypothetical protein